MLLSAMRTLLFSVVLLMAVKSTCQHIDYQVTHFDETTGLESNSINTMLQDSRGYLWFGTPDGLCRYDGYTFKTFRKKSGDPNSLPGNFVVKLTEDREGNIWIGLLNDGISCYHPATGIFRNYNLRNIDSALPFARAVTMLYVDKENNIWAGLVQKGLIKLNKATGSFSRYNIIADTNTFYSSEFRAAYNNVYSMRETGNYMAWLATHDGLYRFNMRTGEMNPVREKPLVRETAAGASRNTLRDDLFNTMLEDSSGLWMGSWAGGLSHYDTKTGKWLNYKFSVRDKNIATSNIVSDIKPKSKNELWISTLDKGFGVFNISSSKFSFLSDSIAHGIPSSSCFSMMMDKQDNIWLACSDGLFKIKQTEKKFIHEQLKVSRSDNGSFYMITTMLEDKKGKYLFTGTAYADGLHITNKQTGKTSAIAFSVVPNEETTQMVTDLMEDTHHNIWVLTRDNVYQCNPVENKLIAIEQPAPYLGGAKSNFLTSIKEDKQGYIWIATARNGVFRYSPADKKYKHYDEHSIEGTLPSNVVVALAVDYRGRTWLAGTRGCFGYFENAAGKFINLHQQKDSLLPVPGNRIHTLYADSHGDIMAGTDAGLYWYNTQGNKPRLKKIYNSDNGLKGDIVTSILQDNNSDIWCTTGSALCKINHLTGDILAFKKQDGIDKINLLNGLYLFQNGQMAAFTSKGSYLFHPATFTTTDKNIPATITSFRIDDKEQYFEEQLKAGQKISVPATANVISFEFAALDFDRPDKQLYAYKLDGFDKDWVMAGQRRYAGYANLPGGDYTFRVKATLSGSNESGPVASLPVHIVQPVYKRWWFITGISLLVIWSVYSFYRFKFLKQQQIYLLKSKAHHLEKEKVQAMYEGLKQQLNPHFLFNSLTSLGSLILYNQQKAVEFLEGLSKIYRYILKSRDTETVSLAEELRFVQTFIHLQQTRFENGLTVKMDVPDEFHTYKITPATLQNLVENAIKHNIIDEDSPLVIEIYIENEYIVVKNNLQRKNFVETSNKQGLLNLISLYHYLISKPVIITEEAHFFYIKIPLI